MNESHPRGRLAIARPTLPVLIGVLFLVAPNTDALVPLQRIDQIRAKSVLTDDDLSTIDTFVNEQINQMLVAESAEQVDDIRHDLLGRRNSSSTSQAWRFYRDRFAGAVKANFQKAYAVAEKVESSELNSHLRLSFVILAAEVDHPDLIETLTPFLQADEELIRYWAAKGLARDNIRQHLLSLPDDDPLLQNVLQSLKSCLEKETSSLVITQIVRAASLTRHPAALSLMQNCLIKRLTAYENWTVTSELYDLDLLTAVCDLIGHDDLSDRMELQRDLLYQAGRLYTAAMQRYAVGMQYTDDAGKAIPLFSENTQTALETLIIEGERQFRKACLRVNPSTYDRTRMLNVIEGQNWNNLQNAYELLLGPEGSVNDVFKVYNNAERRFPYPPLPAPPQAVIEKARNRLQIQNKVLDLKKE